MVDLSESDEDRFERLRNRLSDVDRAEPAGRTPLTEPRPLDPMLAVTFEGSLESLETDAWYAEPKYDGTRILLEVFEDGVSLFTRRHVDRADSVPAVTTAASDQVPAGTVLDGELTFLDGAGRSVFTPIHTASEKRSELTPRYFAFDVLVDDTQWVLREPLEDRKDRLRSLLSREDPLSLVEPRTTGFQAFYDGLVERGEEGIMLKRRTSPYHPDTRSRHWRKVKAFTEVDVLVVGTTPGEGRRASTFGALVLRDPVGYVGRVGSGFDQETLEAVAETLERTGEREIPRTAVGRRYDPVDPVVATVRVQSVTDDRKLRAPVFVRLRPEKPVDTVEPVDEQAG